MESNVQPLVSVVTPVYNGEKYLAECIESVLSQSYENWEYLIVNNCSTDGSPDIAKEYAKRDKRILVHHNTEFLPIIHNWNHALSLISSRSRYCKVVHADDWLFPNCISKMVRIAEEHPEVGIVGAHRLEGDTVAGKLPYPGNVVSGRDICNSTLKRDFSFGLPTALLIRSDLIRQRGRFYNEAYFHADKEACYDILQHCDFGFVHETLSYTRRHSTSQTMMYAQVNNTVIMENLGMLLKYGPIYLNPQEYAATLHSEAKSYYEFLGRSFFQLRGKDFWLYHWNSLRKIRFPFSVLQMGRAFVRISLSNVMNPRKAAEKALKSLGLRSGGDNVYET